MYVCTDTHIHMNIFIIEWSLSLSQYLFRLREGSSCSPKEKNSCFKGNYKNCSFVLHFFHTDFVAVWLWSENELQKLKAVKFSWISLSISVYYLKTLLQPNPTLNHEINQSFLIRSRLRKKTQMLLQRLSHLNISLFWLRFSSLLKTTCANLPGAHISCRVMELVAAGSSETSIQCLPSADPVTGRSEDHPWRNQGAAGV